MKKRSFVLKRRGVLLMVESLVIVLERIMVVVVEVQSLSMGLCLPILGRLVFRPFPLFLFSANVTSSIMVA
jgi:hypothetical protein